MTSRRKKIFCFDLDNVLCKTKGSNYKKSLPLKRKHQNSKHFKSKRKLYKNIHLKIYGKK